MFVADISKPKNLPIQPKWPNVGGVDRRNGQVERAADRLGDVAGGDALLGDGVQPGTCGRLRQPERDQSGGVGAVHGGPAVGAVPG